MKAKKITNQFDEPAKEPQIDAYVKGAPASPRVGMIMNVAILAHKVGANGTPEPYRTFKTVGEKEYFALCEFLESIGFAEYPNR
ncbi:hypothetical protein L5157_002523 [Vibrio parahaemolyticus]|nr:hypothetical protein [Vibrio parahaemolyticus]